jgi:hypothetical protein
LSCLESYLFILEFLELSSEALLPFKTTSPFTKAQVRLYVLKKFLFLPAFLLSQ